MKEILFVLIIGLLIFPLGSLGCGTTEAATESAPVAPAVGGVIDVEEFIKNAQAGKYKNRDIVNITGVYDGEELLNDADFMVFYVGPEVEGLKVFAKVARPNLRDWRKFRDLSIGQKITFRGEYEGQVVHRDNGPRRGVAVRFAKLIE